MLKYTFINITTSDYIKFMRDILDAEIKQKELVYNSDVPNLIQKSDLYTKLVTLARKAELKAERDKIVSMQTFDLSYILGRSFFGGR